MLWTSLSILQYDKSTHWVPWNNTGCYELFYPYDIFIIAQITYAMNLFCRFVWKWLHRVWIWNCLDLNMKLPLTWTLIWNCHLLELEYEIITHLILNLTYWNHNLLELQFEIAFTWTKYPPLGRWEEMILITWIHVIKYQFTFIDS